MACNKNWLIEPEGILFSLTLWLSFCANLTIIFAFPNEYVQKHFILTLTCTSWIALFYISLLKLNFFEGKIACTKSQNITSIFGIATSVVAALILMLSDSKFDNAHSDPDQNSGINWFCMLEQFLVALMYLSIMFIEKVVAHVKTLKLCMPNSKEKSESQATPEETNDNFQNTQHIVVPIETAPVQNVDSENENEVVEKAEVEQTPVEASFEIIPEQNNKQSDDASEHDEENSQQNLEASENDELIAAPSKETHAKVGERSTEERKDSDV